MSDENISGKSPRRKGSNHSPRAALPSGYTSEDERLSSRYIHESLMAEFIANIDAFIAAYVDQDGGEVARCVALINRQIAAFKALERSIYGELFAKFTVQPEENTLMRSFYVGCLYQVVHPQVIFIPRLLDNTQ